MSQTKEISPRQQKLLRPAIEVAQALPMHALAVREIYFEGRVDAQANGKLTRERMVTEFRDRNSTITGRTTQAWLEMIMDRSRRQAVLVSFTRSSTVKSHEESPQGIVRPSIADDGVRWLNNLYVHRSNQGSGHGAALFEAVSEWHQGEEFRLRVAAYNDRGIAFYQKLGCVAADVPDLGYEIQGVFVPQVEMVSPAAN